ncbi:MAG: 16S rRNA processing protein RimM [Bacteriovoracaceae bacterium]|nr:16S rRNA processing protein RimM [Bacteriovoracaceae bacterium]
MKEKEKLIHLGSCQKPHGIKGGFSAHLINAEDSSLSKGKTLLLKPKSAASSLSKDGELFKVKSMSFGNKCILYFEEVQDRNLVEAMLPFDIFIKRVDMPEPEEGLYYLEDLVGLKVLNDKNEEIGSVKTYFDNGAQTVLVIKKDDSTIELPFIDNFFPEVDIEEGFIKMVEPEII